MWRVLGPALIVAACGDNTHVEPDGPTPPPLDGIPLATADDMIIVAHQDDDLLFMQPDMFDLVSNHHPVTVVYVTAGDGNAGVERADSRIVAVKAAYGAAAGVTDWRCGWLDLDQHLAQHCRLEAGNVSLVFLGYPDGGVSGQFPFSLLQLWEGQVDHVQTIAARASEYDQAGLVATVAQIISTTQPRVIRTLDVGASHGLDHSDHMIVGALTVLAAMTAATDATLISYRGYNINSEPANTPDSIYDRASLPMRAYEACQIGCGVCGEVACPTLDDPRYFAFVHHRYAIGSRSLPLRGRLSYGTQCVTIATGGRVILADCSRATTFAFERGGHIRVGDRCLVAQPTGELTADTCGGSAGRRFLLDDEGHLWAGLVAPPAPNMDYMHTMCVVAEGRRLEVQPCGADRDVRWNLMRTPVSTLRATLGISRTGRAVRVADLTGDGKADLCAIEPGGLSCADGDGTGRFGAAHRIDSAAAPLSIEPVSLALGDVDGDGRLDACGRDAGGISCATAASGFAATRWSPVFARTGGACANDRSLAIVDGEVCGRSDTGFVCVAKGTTSPTIRSTWPLIDAPLWPGDLDSDGIADWCAATPLGPACGLSSDQAITTDGLAWGYAQTMIVEGSSASDGTIADTARGALADVSGDRRADLCVIVNHTVQCALSQGRGFGPRRTAMTLPAGTTPTALWLGDLDADGKADPCVDDGTSITCAISP
jgi:LmbE family N-acetylglucosaminyl deacetylase